MPKVNSNILILLTFFIFARFGIELPDGLGLIVYYINTLVRMLSYRSLDATSA